MLYSFKAAYLYYYLNANISSSFKGETLLRAGYSVAYLRRVYSILRYFAVILILLGSNTILNIINELLTRTYLTILSIR